MDERDRLQALVDLLDSPGWRVVVSMLQEKLNRLGRALDSPSDTASLGETRFLQGQRVEIRTQILWPENEIKALRAKLQ